MSLVLSNLADTDADGIQTETMLVEPDHHAMTQIAALAEAGKLRAEIDSIFSLEDAAKAHERGDTGRVTGKIVLTV
ncbi:Synaptic vesicle membrane protein VAT-1-like protein [Mycobacterium tuberculosis]|nr:Synaptic vesicle membrane protein VAT-1-like protein [Mycobacterium tuberculosis]